MDSTCPECQGPKAPTNRLCPDCWRRSGGRRWSDPERGVGFEFEDGPPRRGIGDLVAVALVVLNLDVIHRSTVRALCPDKMMPRADGSMPKSKVNTQVNRAYRRFEANGWARRDGAFVRVHDRAALRSWVEQGVDISDAHAATMLSVEQAAKRINTDLETGAAVSGWDAATARRHAEVRRQELIALQRLMQAAPTRSPGVRIVPRGRAL